MLTTINREEVQRMIAEGAQLVDVRSDDDYQDEHIRGAFSLPLTALDRRSAGQLDRGRAVITSCWDSQ